MQLCHQVVNDIGKILSIDADLCVEVRIFRSFIEKTIAESGLVDDVYVYGIPSANQVPGEKDVVAAVVPAQ